MKHTPGPWIEGRLGNFRIYGPPNIGRESGPIAESLPVNDTEKQRANARLIAAAPELLEALEEWHSPYDGWNKAELVKRYDYPTVRRIYRTRAAIAKAT